MPGLKPSEGLRQGRRVRGRQASLWATFFSTALAGGVPDAQTGGACPTLPPHCGRDSSRRASGAERLPGQGSVEQGAGECRL